ncbi:MAG: type IV pilus modification PilV family protein [Planctomycetota bacterium]|jgi:hypothetical protein
MRRALRRLGRKLGERAGMTVMEVLLSLAIFLIGSVGVIGLFVTASVLHAEASNRRTASFIANELLAQVKGLRLREVFAQTNVFSDPGGDVLAERVYANIDHQSAAFDQYPILNLFFPLRDGQETDRDEGPILIGSEWIWYTGLLPIDDDSEQFTGCSRGLWGTTAASHSAGDPILQPRTWFYVVDDQDLVNAGWQNLAADAGVVVVRGDPTSFPNDPGGANDGAPPQGYLVIDEEWFRYASRSYNAVDGVGTFIFSDLNNDGLPDRGWGGTEQVEHKCGTPVTIAREHPFYPGFYYTVQFYPLNPNVTAAQVVVSVAYRTGNLFRTWFFRGIYTPSKF